MKWEEGINHRLRQQTSASLTALSVLIDDHPRPGRVSAYWVVCLSSVVSWCWICGTPCIAARMFDAELPLAAAAFTCCSRTFQYPLGSAQPGIGCRAALETAGPALCSAALSTCGSPAVAAELTAVTVVTSPFPCLCVQAPYCWAQLTGTR